DRLRQADQGDHRLNRAPVEATTTGESNMRSAMSTLVAVAGFCLLSIPATVAQETTAAKERQTLLNPDVAGLGDNTWVKLNTPKTSPICRSSSPWMAYAPQAGVGILWGCSHSYWENDVWTFDLARNEWKEMLRTEPSVKKDPDAIKIKDGVMMTREERP